MPHGNDIVALSDFGLFAVGRRGRRAGSLEESRYCSGSDAENEESNEREARDVSNIVAMREEAAHAHCELAIEIPEIERERMEDQRHGGRGDSAQKL